MLTKDEIKKNLQKDHFWEPSEDATDKEWDLYEEAYNEVQQEKTLNKGESESGKAYDFGDEEMDYDLDENDLDDLGDIEDTDDDDDDDYNDY